jgi:hypothetical protein
MGYTVNGRAQVELKWERVQAPGAGDETANDRRVISKPKRRHVIESGVFGAGLGAAGGGGDIMDTAEMDAVSGEVGAGRHHSPRHRMPLTH